MHTDGNDVLRSKYTLAKLEITGPILISEPAFNDKTNCVGRGVSKCKTPIRDPGCRDVQRFWLSKLLYQHS